MLIQEKLKLDNGEFATQCTCSFCTIVLAKCRGMVAQTVFEHVELVYGDTFIEGF